MPCAALPWSAVPCFPMLCCDIMLCSVPFVSFLFLPFPSLPFPFIPFHSISLRSVLLSSLLISSLLFWKGREEKWLVVLHDIYYFKCLCIISRFLLLLWFTFQVIGPGATVNSIIAAMKSDQSTTSNKTKGIVVISYFQDDFNHVFFMEVTIVS